MTGRNERMTTRPPTGGRGGGTRVAPGEATGARKHDGRGGRALMRAGER
jgi:hypothetical protein